MTRIGIKGRRSKVSINFFLNPLHKGVFFYRIGEGQTMIGTIKSAVFRGFNILWSGWLRFRLRFFLWGPINIYIYIYMYVYMNIYVYISENIYVYIDIDTYIFKYTCIFVYAYIYMYIYIYTYSYIL
jgi:hypothetical protein